MEHTIETLHQHQQTYDYFYSLSNCLTSPPSKIALTSYLYYYYLCMRRLQLTAFGNFCLLCFSLHRHQPVHVRLFLCFGMGNLDVLQDFTRSHFTYWANSVSLRQHVRKVGMCSLHATPCSFLGFHINGSTSKQQIFNSSPGRSLYRRTLEHFGQRLLPLAFLEADTVGHFIGISACETNISLNELAVLVTKYDVITIPLLLMFLVDPNLLYNLKPHLTVIRVRYSLNLCTI